MICDQPTSRLTNGCRLAFRKVESFTFCHSYKRNANLAASRDPYKYSCNCAYVAAVFRGRGPYVVVIKMPLQMATCPFKKKNLVGYDAGV